MEKQSIRLRAAAIFHRDGKILTHRVHNTSDGKTWYIPPGGGVTYGEMTPDALRREIREEFSWEIQNIAFLGCFESFHLINDVEEHEVSFVFSATPVDASNLEFDSLEIEEPNGKRKTFQWVDPEVIQSQGSLLYPNGLMDELLNT